MNTPDVIFPYIGIQIQNLPREAFSFFGLSIYWYGLLIVVGIICGVYAPWRLAKADMATSGKRPGTPISPEQVLDFACIVIPIAIVGTRMYYVFSMWDNYKDDLLKIFAVREGGLAIHGAIISAIVTLVIYARVKKYDVLRFADVCVVGLPIGQAIGRWGNFMNQEVFGTYTNTPLAMCYRLDAVSRSNVNAEILEHLYRVGGMEYIQVHPTFLYESLWSLATFIFLMLYFNRRKFNGEIIALYLFLYGFARFFIEGIRTDQLKLFNTDIPSAQVVSALMAIAASVFMLVRHIQVKRQANRPADKPLLFTDAEAADTEDEMAAEINGELADIEEGIEEMNTKEPTNE